MNVRLTGAGLLGVCLFALYRLHGVVTMLPHHPPSVAEMLLSLTAVVTGIGGALAISYGPALFESHPWPPLRRPDGE